MTYLRASQAAVELGITVTSLYKMKDNPDPDKKLEPVNPNTYRGDGGYVYRAEDVARIKSANERMDLTSAEAAKRIGRSTTYIHKLIRDGSIPYYEGELRGKKTYFIKEPDLLKFATCNPDNGKYDMIYDKATGAFLFQPYHKESELARIVRMKRVNRRKKEITLQISSGENLLLEQAIEEGWKPTLTITEKRAITSYGYASFDFPLPSTLDSMIYKIIEEFFMQIGPANIRITTTGKRLLVEVKKSVLLGILPTTHPDMIDKLKLFIKSGDITAKFDGTLIDTGLSPITVYLPEKTKTELVRLASEDNRTLQEWLEQKLIQYV